MKDRRIVLVGFMGSGKTSVAKELARLLDCHFVDLDTFIAESEGRSPAEIIQTDGEPEFRVVETRTLEQALNPGAPRVIALGGGTWTIDSNRAQIARHNCLTVWLDAPFDLCWKRITSTSVVRPLAPDKETARARYESRRSDYALAERRVSINESETAGTVAEKILKLR